MPANPSCDVVTRGSVDRRSTPRTRWLGIPAEEARRGAVADISTPEECGVEGHAMNDGKLLLVVRSRRVARLVEFEAPLFTVHGKALSRTGRAIVYDYVLDERQSRALSQSREFASRLGLALEVTDLSKEGAVRRLLRSAAQRLAGGRRPAPPVSQEPEGAVPVGPASRS